MEIGAFVIQIGGRGGTHRRFDIKEVINKLEGRGVKMKKLLLSIILLIASSTLMSQEDNHPSNAKNAVFVELLGNSVIIYNVTYDRIIYSDSSFKASVSQFT